jgi:hypothetical protein
MTIQNSVSTGVRLSCGTSILGLLAIILLAVKLILVSQHEVVIAPNDSTTYVRMSLDRLSIFDKHHHPPGTSYVIWCARAFGIPYRIFEEIILALMVFLFLRPLAACRLGLGIAIPVFALIIFNPNLIISMDNALSEPVYLFFLLAGLGGVLGAIFAPRDRSLLFNLALTVVAFGFLALVRDDGQIVWVGMTAAAVFSLVFLRSSEGWRFKRAVVACGCAIAANLIVGQAMSAAAYTSHGFWGISPVQSREWWGLYSALLALPVPRNERHAFINEQNLDLAAKLSPTFAKYRSCLEDARKKADNLRILNAHIQWRLMECVHREIEEIKRMRAEIIQGAREQNIKLQRPMLGIIPEPISQWLPFLLPSALNVLGDVNSNPATLVSDMNQYSLPDESFPEKERWFNEGLLRRSALANNSTNPEIPGYGYLLSVVYPIVSATGLMATGFILLLTPVLLLTGRPHVGGQLIIFAMALVSFDIASRIGYYTIVDWVGWRIYSRYMLSAQVLLAFPAITAVALSLRLIWTRIRQGLSERVRVE